MRATGSRSGWQMEGIDLETSTETECEVSQVLKTFLRLQLFLLITDEMSQERVYFIHVFKQIITVGLGMDSQVSVLN